MLERVYFRDGEVLNAVELNTSFDRIELQRGLQGLRFGLAGMGEGSGIGVSLDHDQKGVVNVRFQRMSLQRSESTPQKTIPATIQRRNMSSGKQLTLIGGCKTSNAHARCQRKCLNTSERRPKETIRGITQLNST